MGILKLVFVVFFVANALFWGLWPHSSHCQLAASLGMTKCVPHIMHIMFGIGFFVVAVLVAQWGKLSMVP